MPVVRAARMSITMLSAAGGVDGGRTNTAANLRCAGTTPRPQARRRTAHRHVPNLNAICGWPPGSAMGPVSQVPKVARPEPGHGGFCLPPPYRGYCLVAPSGAGTGLGWCYQASKASAGRTRLCAGTAQGCPALFPAPSTPDTVGCSVTKTAVASGRRLRDRFKLLIPSASSRNGGATSWRGDTNLWNRCRRVAPGRNAGRVDEEPPRCPMWSARLKHDRTRSSRRRGWRPTWGMDVGTPARLVLLATRSGCVRRTRGRARFTWHPMREEHRA
jgi:hypothetical protein